MSGRHIIFFVLVTTIIFVASIRLDIKKPNEQSKYQQENPILFFNYEFNKKENIKCGDGNKCHITNSPLNDFRKKYSYMDRNSDGKIIRCVDRNLYPNKNIISIEKNKGLIIDLKSNEQLKLFSGENSNIGRLKDLILSYSSDFEFRTKFEIGRNNANDRVRITTSERIEPYLCIFCLFNTNKVKKKTMVDSDDLCRNIDFGLVLIHGNLKFFVRGVHTEEISTMNRFNSGGIKNCQEPVFIQTLFDHSNINQWFGTEIDIIFRSEFSDHKNRIQIIFPNHGINKIINVGNMFQHVDISNWSDDDGMRVFIGKIERLKYDFKQEQITPNIPGRTLFLNLKQIKFIVGNDHKNIFDLNKNNIKNSVELVKESTKKRKQSNKKIDGYLSKLIHENNIDLKRKAVKKWDEFEIGPLDIQETYTNQTTCIKQTCRFPFLISYTNNFDQKLILTQCTVQSPDLLTKDPNLVWVHNFQDPIANGEMVLLPGNHTFAYEFALGLSNETLCNDPTNFLNTPFDVTLNCSIDNTPTTILDFHFHPGTWEIIEANPFTLANQQWSIRLTVPKQGLINQLIHLSYQGNSRMWDTNSVSPILTGNSKEFVFRVVGHDHDIFGRPLLLENVAPSLLSGNKPWEPMNYVQQEVIFGFLGSLLSGLNDDMWVYFLQYNPSHVNSAGNLTTSSSVAKDLLLPESQEFYVVLNHGTGSSSGSSNIVSYFREDSYQNRYSTALNETEITGSENWKWSERNIVATSTGMSTTFNYETQRYTTSTSWSSSRRYQVFGPVKIGQCFHIDIISTSLKEFYVYSWDVGSTTTGMADHVDSTDHLEDYGGVEICLYKRNDDSNLASFEPNLSYELNRLDTTMAYELDNNRTNEEFRYWESRDLNVSTTDENLALCFPNVVNITTPECVYDDCNICNGDGSDCLQFNQTNCPLNIIINRQCLIDNTKCYIQPPDSSDAYKYGNITAILESKYIVHVNLTLVKFENGTISVEPSFQWKCVNQNTTHKINELFSLQYGNFTVFPTLEQHNHTNDTSIYHNNCTDETYINRMIEQEITLGLIYECFTGNDSSVITVDNIKNELVVLEGKVDIMVTKNITTECLSSNITDLCPKPFSNDTFVYSAPCKFIIHTNVGECYLPPGYYEQIAHSNTAHVQVTQFSDGLFCGTTWKTKQIYDEGDVFIHFRTCYKADIFASNFDLVDIKLIYQNGGQMSLVGIPPLPVKKVIGNQYCYDWILRSDNSYFENVESHLSSESFYVFVFKDISLGHVVDLKIILNIDIVYHLVSNVNGPNIYLHLNHETTSLYNTSVCVFKNESLNELATTFVKNEKVYIKLTLHSAQNPFVSCEHIANDTNRTESGATQHDCIESGNNKQLVLLMGRIRVCLPLGNVNNPNHLFDQNTCLLDDGVTYGRFYTILDLRDNYHYFFGGIWGTQITYIDLNCTTQILVSFKLLSPCHIWMNSPLSIVPSELSVVYTTKGENGPINDYNGQPILNYPINTFENTGSEIESYSGSGKKDFGCCNGGLKRYIPLGYYGSNSFYLVCPGSQMYDHYFWMECVTPFYYYISYALSELKLLVFSLLMMLFISFFLVLFRFAPFLSRLTSVVYEDEKDDYNTYLYGINQNIDAQPQRSQNNYSVYNNDYGVYNNFDGNYERQQQISQWLNMSNNDPNRTGLQNRKQYTRNSDTSIEYF